MLGLFISDPFLEILGLFAPTPDCVLDTDGGGLLISDPFLDTLGLFAPAPTPDCDREADGGGLFICSDPFRDIDGLLTPEGVRAGGGGWLPDLVRSSLAGWDGRRSGAGDLG